MAIEFSHEANQSPASAERREEILKNPGFGDYFTDHMVTAPTAHTPAHQRPQAAPAAPTVRERPNSKNAE